MSCDCERCDIGGFESLEPVNPQETYALYRCDTCEGGYDYALSSKGILTETGESVELSDVDVSAASDVTANGTHGITFVATHPEDGSRVQMSFDYFDLVHEEHTCDWDDRPDPGRHPSLTVGERNPGLAGRGRRL